MARSLCRCVLWKLFKLRLTRRQIDQLLRSRQCDHFRALGLLYVRLCVKPEQQWKFYQETLYDDTEVVKTAVRKDKITIAQLTQDLIRKNKFFNVILPRIPVPMQRRWIAELDDSNKDAAYDEHGGGDRAASGGSRRRARSPGYRRERSRSRSPGRR